MRSCEPFFHLSTRCVRSLILFGVRKTVTSQHNLHDLSCFRNLIRDFVNVSIALHHCIEHDEYVLVIIKHMLHTNVQTTIRWWCLHSSCKSDTSIVFPSLERLFDESLMALVPTWACFFWFPRLFSKEAWRLVYHSKEARRPIEFSKEADDHRKEARREAEFSCFFSCFFERCPQNS